MNSNELVNKYQELKNKHSELMSEKIKYEARKDQLMTEIKAIQDKYPEYDLTSVESVENIIKDLTNTLNIELTSINEQYTKIKNL